jgi:hypothetical protein
MMIIAVQITISDTQLSNGFVFGPTSGALWVNFSTAGFPTSTQFAIYLVADVRRLRNVIQ